jgi:hypothetical protein
MVRWVQLNGQIQKKNHARATQRYMHNNIAGIHSVDGVFREDHQQKAADFCTVSNKQWGCLIPLLRHLIYRILYIQWIIYRHLQQTFL